MIAEFIGGPLDGSTRDLHPPLDKLPFDIIDAATGSRYECSPALATGQNMPCHYMGAISPPAPVVDRLRDEVGRFQREAEAVKPTGPLPEVTVHGAKLMTLGQMQQFVDAARAAGYPDTHIPAVINSFGGRIRSLTAKTRRRTT